MNQAQYTVLTTLIEKNNELLAAILAEVRMPGLPQPPAVEPDPKPPAGKPKRGAEPSK